MPRANGAVNGAGVASGTYGRAAGRELAGSGRAETKGQARLAEVARGGTLNLAGAFVSALATVGVTILVTRQFDKLVAGAFFTAISVFLIAEAIGSLGAKTGAVYFIARLRSLGEERRIPTILRAAVIPVVTVSVVVAAVMFVLAGPLSHVLLTGHLSNGKVSPNALAQALRALAVALPFAALLDAFLGATRGYRDMRCTVAVDNVGRSVGQLLGVLVAAALGSAALLAPLWVLPYIPAAAVAWLWLSRLRRHGGPGRSGVPDIPPELAFLMSLAKPVTYRGSSRRPAGSGHRMARRRLANANPRGFWLFTAPRAVASLAQITLQRIDIVLVAIMRGPAEAAVYTAATRFLVAGQLGSTAISNAAQPRFTEFFALGDTRNANVIYQVTTAWLVLLTWPLYLLAIVYGPAVLAVFGHSYQAGNDVMIILGVAMLIGSASGLVDMVLITSGRSGWSLANGLLALGVNVGLDLLLIPTYGITGAAIGWAVAIVVSNLVPLAQVAASMRLHPLGRGSIVACALTALCFCGIPLAVRTVLGTGTIAAAAGVALGCAVMAVGLWRFHDALRLSAMPGLSFLNRRRPALDDG
jgi:O-antigen/teichoic acid export membrane protein